MSQETLEYHWGKHHRGYVENLNKQIVGTELDGMSLEDIVIVSYNKGDLLPTFNNAGQVSCALVLILVVILNCLSLLSCEDRHFFKKIS